MQMGVVVYCIVSSFLSFLPAQCFQDGTNVYLNFEWTSASTSWNGKSYLMHYGTEPQYTFSEVSLISGKSLGSKILP